MTTTFKKHMAAIESGNVTAARIRAAILKAKESS